MYLVDCPFNQLPHERGELLDFSIRERTVATPGKSPRAAGSFCVLHRLREPTANRLQSQRIVGSSDSSDRIPPPDRSVSERRCYGAGNAKYIPSPTVNNQKP